VVAVRSHVRRIARPRTASAQGVPQRIRSRILALQRLPRRRRRQGQRPRVPRIPGQPARPPPPRTPGRAQSRSYQLSPFSSTSSCQLHTTGLDDGPVTYVVMWDAAGAAAEEDPSHSSCITTNHTNNHSRGRHHTPLTAADPPLPISRPTATSPTRATSPYHWQCTPVRRASAARQRPYQGPGSWEGEGVLSGPPFFFTAHQATKELLKKPPPKKKKWKLRPNAQ
jgi:hypothetical protein